MSEDAHCDCLQMAFESNQSQSMTENETADLSEGKVEATTEEVRQGNVAPSEPDGIMNTIDDDIVESKDNGVVDTLGSHVEDSKAEPDGIMRTRSRSLSPVARFRSLSPVSQMRSRSPSYRVSSGARRLRSKSPASRSIGSRSAKTTASSRSAKSMGSRSVQSMPVTGISRYSTLQQSLPPLPQPRDASLYDPSEVDSEDEEQGNIQEIRDDDSQCSDSSLTSIRSTSKGLKLVMIVSDILHQTNNSEIFKEKFRKGKNHRNAMGKLESLYKQERVVFGEDYVEVSESSSLALSTIGGGSKSRHTDDVSSAHSKASRASRSRISMVSSRVSRISSRIPAKPRTVKLDPASDPFAPRKGRTLRWSGVSMTVGRRKAKKVLDNVWGEVPAQQTTVIMGGSGAGKSSLLNVLSGRTQTRGNVRVESNIRLDNYGVDPTNIKMRQRIAFVAQDDSLQFTATPREAIRFSAKLRLGRKMNNDQLDELTEVMLEELGLTACADTIVGGPLLKGISGGERKRTSVGVELVVKPAMVFLDEPTSGLDSFSAVQVCQLLQKVAHAGASVMFTIHQPSSRIFREFDHLILMKKGRVMYSGSVNSIHDYFAERNYPCPDDHNPADWIMTVAQRHEITELEESGFFSQGKEITASTRQSIRQSMHGLMTELFQDGAVSDRPPSFMTQIGKLIKREIANIRRSRAVTIARIVQSTVLGVLVGVIFFRVGSLPPDKAQNLQSHFGAIVIVSTIVMMGPAQAALLSFPEERPIFLREYTTDHYAVTSYFLSRLGVEAIMGALQTAIIVAITFYMIQFQGDFLYFLLACYALAMGSTAIAVVLGALSGSSTKIANTTLPLALLPQMLFIGYFVQPELIPTWLNWFHYCCPMTYSTRLLLLQEFSDCSDVLLGDYACNLLLTSVKAEEDDTWWYWIILGVQFVLLRLAGLFILQRSANKFY